MLDNYDMYVRHEAKQNAMLERLPVCCCCGKRIQDDVLYDINGDLYCEDCMKEEFMRSVDSYIDD